MKCCDLSWRFFVWFKQTVHTIFFILHHLLAFHFFKTCMTFFLLCSTIEDILENAGIQTIDGPGYFFPHSMEVNGYRQLFGY